MCGYREKIVHLKVNKLNLIEVRNFVTSREHNYFEFHAPLSILIKQLYKYMHVHRSSGKS